ncbi:MAG: ATP-dependent sacrificial sulfur transferase LarE [Oscillospiraceae bacterium]
MASLEEKFDILRSIIKDYGRVGIAFSGGVDSTLLLKVAHDVLGDNAVAFTAAQRSVPAFELKEAEDFCRTEGILQIVCEINELETPEFTANPADRCYYCKRNVLSRIIGEAGKLGISQIAEGSNVDDMGDFRPGRKAVLERGVSSPLLEAGLTKDEIRALSKQLKLPTWDKPAYACLASRIVRGESITEEKLRMIEKAEGFLMENGFRQMRVRVHGDLARIEVPPENIEKLATADFRKKLVGKFQELGFRYVSLDLDGYKMGSMNPKEV